MPSLFDSCSCHGNESNRIICQKKTLNPKSSDQLCITQAVLWIVEEQKEINWLTCISQAVPWTADEQDEIKWLALH